MAWICGKAEGDGVEDVDVERGVGKVEMGKLLEDGAGKGGSGLGSLVKEALKMGVDFLFGGGRLRFARDDGCIDVFDLVE